MNKLSYIEWNNKIASHFFKPENSGKRVWFSVEKDLINRIAKEHNTDFNQFIESVKKGPEWVNRPKQGLCIKAYDAFKNWRDKKELKYPPYVSYLALFVLTVHHGSSDDFSDNAYYGRLRDLLKEKPSLGMYPSFDKMSKLWDDLQKWSAEDKNYSWGGFYNDIHGLHFHVGIPRYQVILKTQDRQSLYDVFWKMGWDSDSQPTEAEILRSIQENKVNFSSRILKRIDKGKDDFIQELVSRVLDELRDYNEEDDSDLENNSEETKKRGFIHVYMSNIDSLNKKAEFSFRCKRQAGLPDVEELTLKTDHYGNLTVPIGASTTLSGKIIDHNIDWSKDFSANMGKYKFCYTGSKYKIFTSAESSNISGWTSAKPYTPSQLFYLCVHKSLVDKVKKWGTKECGTFEECRVSGLPDKWFLFKIKEVKSDSLIKKDIPALTVDSKVRICFEGGIRCRGNKFFHFAPPKITVRGGGIQDSIKTSCFKNGQKISSSQGRSFYIPQKTPANMWINIKALSTKDPNSEVTKQIMFVTNRLPKMDSNHNILTMDAFGNLNQEKSNESYIQGACVYGWKNQKEYTRFPLKTTKKVYLTGNVAGQITIWPDEALPDLWTPVWSIEYKNRKQATAEWLGNRDNKSLSYNGGFSKEKTKLWYKLIWYRRKRITPRLQFQQHWKNFLKRIQRNVKT